MQRLLFCLLALSAWSKGAEEGPFVSVWPEKPVVKYGDSIVLNCSVSCEHDNKYGLETSLTKKVIASGPNWKAFKLENVNQWMTAPLCYANCGGKGMKTQRTNITVYQPPQSVVLDPLPEMQVGKNYTLTCRVLNVAPIRNLTVAILRGTEELHVQSFANHAAPEAGDVIMTHSITAQLSNHGEEFSCQTTLDLSPEGQLLKNASLNQSLMTFDFPEDPELQTLHCLESHAMKNVTCSVAKVFPAKEAQFDLTFAGERLNFSFSVLDGHATAQAQVSSSSAGEHELSCTVTLGPVTRTVVKTVKVYSLSSPILHIDPQEILVNKPVNFTCNSNFSGFPSISMRLKDSKNAMLESVDGPSLRFIMPALREDDGRQFTCEAELMENGHQVAKKTSSASVMLTVFYGPLMNDSSCPSNVTWTDGSKETFNCSSWGNPKPMVECRKDDLLIRIGEQWDVTKETAGLYLCNATNVHGSVVRHVTIYVESHQLNTLVIGLVALIVVALGTAAGVAYKMHYNAHKIKKYRLKQQQRQAAGIPMEEKCLNGNAQAESV